MKKFLNLKYLLIGLFLLGIVLRLGLSFLGHNFDVDSYNIVGEIVKNGGNVYAETSRYNYGPIWAYVLGILYSLSSLFSNHFEVFRFLIVIFLTLVDIGIFYLLLKNFGKKIAFLFFLNPISIFITGYHSQFDNLAIFLGLLGVLLFGENIEKAFTRRKYLGLLFIALSLITKHLLFIFPLWLALKQKGILSKFKIILIPFALFAVSFLPFIQTGFQGILNNIFLYRSFANAPFWYMFLPEFYRNLVPSFVLFVLALLFAGILLRKKKVLESFLFYLFFLVIFSSGIANQYLAIVIPFIAVNFNIFFLLFTFVASVFLLTDPAGLNSGTLKSIIPIKLVSYNIQVLLLTLGVTWLLFKDRVRSLVRKTIKFIQEEIRYQIRGL